MLVETFVVGMLATNCYVASSKQTKDTVIIDPGIDFRNEAQPIMDYIAQSKLKITSIINTHGHQDHVNGNTLFQEEYRVPISIHPLDAYFLEETQQDAFPANVLLEEGSNVTLGNETLKVLHTPGHTPGSICLVGEKLVFTGDTLFAGSIGRTDFPEGSAKDMRLSLQKIAELPDYLLVYPGHGEATSMGREKKINPFLRGEYTFF
ncbi:MAG: MBL fold metallo-hydrolase [Candidatus Bathyarchaeota archaeon]|nr:MBL fold metallo-hydrolase [Candidatus Bathyarchaeota archaeon]